MNFLSNDGKLVIKRYSHEKNTRTSCNSTTFPITKVGSPSWPKGLEVWSRSFRSSANKLLPEMRVNIQKFDVSCCTIHPIILYYFIISCVQEADLKKKILGPILFPQNPYIFMSWEQVGLILNRKYGTCHYITKKRFFSISKKLIFFFN